MGLHVPPHRLPLEAVRVCVGGGVLTQRVLSYPLPTPGQAQPLQNLKVRQEVWPLGPPSQANGGGGRETGDGVGGTCCYLGWVKGQTMLTIGENHIK